MSSCTLLRREGTLFIFFKRNDNCIFLGIIPSFKLMVFSCRQTICFQQQLNELYSVNHHPTLPIGQQPVWDLKGHGMLRSTRRDCNRLPIFPLQNTDIGRTSKNTDNIFPNIHSPAFRRNCHSQVHNSPRIHVGIPLLAISLPDCCTFSSCPGKSGKGIFSDSSRCGIGIEVVPASRLGSSNTVEL